MAEVAQHDDYDSAWIVHEGKVYDATPFLDDHPGGVSIILNSAGTDATAEFNSIHSSGAKATLARFLIGDLVDETEAAAVVPVVAPASALKSFTMAEVAQHDDYDSAWIVHEGKVYDATPFLDDHPGGVSIILNSAGTDATAEFNSIHSSGAKATLARFLIGDLVEAKEAAAVVPVVVPANALKSFTMEEVAQHDDYDSAWIVHEGKVYDATPFLDDHPGGVSIILNSAGKDASDEFNSIHSSSAKATLSRFLIGDLADAPAAAPTPTAASDTALGAASAGGELVALNPKAKTAFKLVEKVELSHNVRRFRFALQSPQHRLGLPVGNHVLLYATVGGEAVARSYTPTSSADQQGHFDLVIKVYGANENPRFPAGGKMSQHLDSLAVGDSVDVKGPTGDFVYTGAGSFTHNRKAGSARLVSMIAGGTGITPCYQVIKAVLSDPKDSTELLLLYANTTQSDILLREDLDALAAKHANFRVWYTLSCPPPEGWGYSTGRITEQLLRDVLFPPMEGSICLLCGPPPMVDTCCVPHLLSVGFSKQDLIVF